MIRTHIRWMVRRDTPEALEIDASTTDPWGEEAILKALRQRNCIGMVAEHGDRVVGFMIYDLHAKAIKVRHFAVHPEFRRHQIGSQMMAKLVGKLSSQRRADLDLCVRESDLGFQMFLRNQGFMATLVRDAFTGPDEDGYWFKYRLPEPSPVVCMREAGI